MGHSKNTTWAYARALKGFRDSMSRAAPGIPWFQATESDIVRFKAEMAGRSDGSRGRTNDADGIALKLHGINSAFAFAADKRLIPARPFRLARRHGRGSEVPGCPLISVPNSTTKRPRVITAQQLLKIRSRFQLVDEDARRVMDSMTLWSWGTGLREMEVVGICRNKLSAAVWEQADGVRPGTPLREAFSATEAEGFVLELWPAWTKGGHGGTVLVPRDLIKGAVDWMELWPHADATDRFDPVFATRNGRHYEPATIGKYFRSAARAAGIASSFHALRHSYARDS